MIPLLTTTTRSQRRRRFTPVRRPDSKRYSSRSPRPAGGQSDEKGPAARRRPMAAREAYSLYVERAAEGANAADGPLSSLSLHALGVEAPEQVVALFVLLYHGPVSAARQHRHPGAADTLNDLPHRLRGRDRVLVAGDQERRALDGAHLGRLGVRQRVAGA